MRRFWAPATASFFLAISTAAAATPSIAVVFTAPPACPSEAVFLSRLRERTNVIAASRESARLTLETTIEKESESFSGRLVLRDRLGAETSRELSTPTCSDLVDALALTAALSLGIEPPSAEPAPALAVSLPRPAPLPEQPEETAPILAPSAAWDFVARAESAATYGYFPEAIFAVGGSLGVVLGTSNKPAPFLGVGFRSLLPTDRSLPAGTASFRWDLGRLTACPVGWELSGPWSVAPCLHVDLGRIAAESRNGETSLSKDAFWAGGSLGWTLAWRPSRWISGGAEAAVVLPFTRPTFGYGADVDVARAGAIGGEVGVFAALHL